jgi:hypothetical protein
MVILKTQFNSSVMIGRQSWVGPNSSTRDGEILDDNTLIRIGLMVTKLVSNIVTLVGN